MKFKDINSVQATVLQIVSSLARRDIAESVTLDSRLKNDLGFDSLTTLEMCVKIENAMNISIEDKVGNINTVSDIITLIENSGRTIRDAAYNIDDYPLSKTTKHIKQLKSFMRRSRRTWHFKVLGLSNLPADGRYILCPNHQSYYDCLWVWTAIGHNKVDLSKISCLAAEMFLPYKDIMGMLGAIPVERTGNTVPAMKRALTCINEGYTMLIHPEGTRTRDGKIHEFKGGAAKLAIDSGVPLIPVRIEGAWNIFPPHRKRPKVFSWGFRHKLHITFGEPIKPYSRSVDELTSLLQDKVISLGDLK